MSKLDLLDGGHYIWEERADDYAVIVLTRASRGHQAVSASKRNLAPARNPTR